MNKHKESFWVKNDLVKSCLGINIKSSSQDYTKIKNAVKSLKSVGIDLVVTKNKDWNDNRSVFSLGFSYKINKEKAPTLAINQANPTTPPKLKQDSPIISEVKTNQVKTPTPFKENDALIRFKNSIKTLNDSKDNPTITLSLFKESNETFTRDNATPHQ